LAEVDAMLEAQHQRRDRPCSRCGAAIAGHVLVDYHDGVSWTNERICR
jgi:hypothetical protein